MIANDHHHFNSDISNINIKFFAIGGVLIFIGKVAIGIAVGMMI